MKTLIGSLLVLAGIALGLYVGVWICFVSSIIDIIGQIRATELNSGAIAWDILKIMFAGAIGWASALLLVIPGAALIKR